MDPLSARINTVTDRIPESTMVHEKLLGINENDENSRQLDKGAPWVTAKEDTPTPHVKKKRNKIASLESEKTIDLLANDSDHSFCNNFSGLCKKKVNSFRRDKRLFAYEILIPGLIILFGIAVTRSTWFERSPVKYFTPDLLPLPQKIIINQTPIDSKQSDISSTVLGENLP